MGVETGDLDPAGRGRKSVRIESKQTWYQGLFVAEISHMPKSVCGSWPAWWLLGVDGTWPSSGEIDIMEGVSQRTQSLAALHVADTSIIDGDNGVQTGITQTNNCNYNDAAYGPNKNPTGCGVLNSQSSFGTGANNQGGVVTAMEWTDDFIRVWTWPRRNVPADVLGANPKPSTWGKPAQIFEGDKANIKSRFGKQKMIFDTTFCGDWAGNTWKDDGCIDTTGFQTCKEYVAYRGADFAESYWDINQVKIYQKKAPVTTSSVATTSSTRTTLSTTVRTTGVTTSSATSSITTSKSGSATASTVSTVTTTKTGSAVTSVMTSAITSAVTTSAAVVPTTSSTWSSHTSYRYGNSSSTSSYSTSSESSSSSSSSSSTTSFGYTWSNSYTTTEYTTSKTYTTSATVSTSSSSTTSSKSKNPGESSVTGWPNGEYKIQFLRNLSVLYANYRRWCTKANRRMGRLVEDA